MPYLRLINFIRPAFLIVAASERSNFNTYAASEPPELSRNLLWKNHSEFGRF